MNRPIRHARTGNTIDSSGRIINVADAYDVFNQLRTVEYTPIVENKPTPGTSVLRDTTSGPGSLNDDDSGELVLDGTPGLTAAYTRKYGRYLPGLIAVAGVRARMDDPDAGTYRYGYGNGMGNRVGIEVIDGQYRTFLESNGERWYSQERENWIDPLDGQGPSRLNIPDLNGATLRLIFGHYGGLSFQWFLAIGRREGDVEVLIDSSGPREDGVTIAQPDLPIFVETDSTMYIGGRQFGVYGRYKPQYRITSSGGILKDNVGTTFEPIVSFRIKQDNKFQSVPVELADAKAAGTNNGEYRIIIDGNLTAGGAPLDDTDWGDVPGIDPNETAVEMNTNADAITGGYKADADIITGGVGNQQGTPTQDLPDVNLPRNSIVTIAVAANTQTSSFRVVLKVQEEW